jgi:uncharacterized protein with FMN-binding domain
MSPLKRNCIALLACLSVATAFAGPTPDKPVKKSKAEVDKAIDEAGKKPPEWWDATPLNIPPTLDLSWTPPPKGSKWDPQKNMGQYMWDIIDPNPSKWQEGVKLVQHTLTLNKGNQQAQQAAMNTLARVYTEMLQDFERGAFWAKKTNNQPIILAECYLHLGCESAAIGLLKSIGDDNTRNGQVIKLWADAGDLKTALAVAQRKATAGGDPTAAYLAAGDACRRAGNIKQAVSYYEQCIAAAANTQERDKNTNVKHATDNLEAVKLFDSLDLSKIADGAYKGSSIGYVGPVEVTVTMKDHKIEKVEITQHHEKQFYSSMTAVPAQIIQKQALTGIDSSTGATVTSSAIINASAKALAGK